MSTDTRTVGRNAAVQVLGRAGSAVLGLALAAMHTRALGVADYGSLSTALAVLGILAVVHDFGAPPIAVRTLARRTDEAGPLLGRLAVARIAAALPLALLGALALGLAGEGGPFLVWAALLFLFVLLTRSVEIVDVVLQVVQRMGRSVAASLAGRMAHLLGVAGLAAAGVRRPGPLLAAGAVGVAVSAAMRLRLVREWHRLRLRRDLSRLASFLRQVLPSAAATLLMVLYLHVDAILVRGIAGAREAALYNAPYRLFLLGAALPGMIMVSASPILSARWTRDPRGFRRAAAKLLGFGTLAALPVAALAALLARPLLTTLFGPDYGGAEGTLHLLALAAAAAVPGTVATAALIAANRAGWTAILAAVALVVNVSLDVALVPEMGGRGAAVATLVTEILVATGGILLLARAAWRRP